MKYRIYSAAGMDMGIYHAEDRYGALDAFARDAGYKDAAHARQEAGKFTGRILPLTYVVRATLEGVGNSFHFNKLEEAVKEVVRMDGYGYQNVTVHRADGYVMDENGDFSPEGKAWT